MYFPLTAIFEVNFFQALDITFITMSRTPSKNQTPILGIFGFYVCSDQTLCLFYLKKVQNCGEINLMMLKPTRPDIH